MFFYFLYLFIELILGTLSKAQIPLLTSRSLISQANIVGYLIFNWLIASITVGVATLGLEPPIEPGLIDPVWLNLLFYLYKYYLN